MHVRARSSDALAHMPDTFEAACDDLEEHMPSTSGQNCYDLNAQIPCTPELVLQVQLISLSGEDDEKIMMVNEQHEEDILKRNCMKHRARLVKSPYVHCRRSTRLRKDERQILTYLATIDDLGVNVEDKSMMESSDDEKNIETENVIPKDLSYNSALSGTKFVEEVLSGQNELCQENFRMDKQIFYKLCDISQAKGLLRHTNRIKIEEQLAIFLFIIGHNQRTRAVQERFRYSGETISRHFNNVLNAIMSISLDFFQSPGSDIPPEIMDDPRFYPYFKDCIGAVDGIHIPVMVGVDEQGPFRNKTGFLSQNVLAACSFDLRFHYVLAGWEGSAADMRVLNSALTRRNKLHVPEGKYYLVDKKYANMPGFVAPYHGTPYHLSEFSSGFHPQDAKEFFNFRHSLLRNVMHRAFEVLKARFPILMSTPPYPLQTQVKLVVAACALHNFIRKEKEDDWLFEMYEHETWHQTEEPMQKMEIDTQASDTFLEAEQVEMASQVRDCIAAEMWNDYVRDLSSM